jgi:hypothetical protein
MTSRVPSPEIEAVRSRKNSEVVEAYKLNFKPPTKKRTKNPHEHQMSFGKQPSPMLSPNKSNINISAIKSPGQKLHRKSASIASLLSLENDK